jgi:cell division protein FtsW
MNDLAHAAPSWWPRLALWLLVLGLCGFGLVMVASTTAGRGGDGASLSHLLRQGAAMGVGLVAAVAISALGVRRLRSTALVLGVFFAAMLALVLVLGVGRSINGARRWIDLGPINIQPAEIAKLALILAAAWHFAQVGEAVRSVWHGVLLPLCGFAVLAGLVFLTKDLGTVVVLFLVLAGLVVWSGARWFYLLAITVMALPFAAFHAVVRETYRFERIVAFLDPFAASGPAGYHLVQASLAIGSGGIWGVGLGNGMAKERYLPENHTDFIFAVICEELGMVGASGIAGAFLALVVVGLVIALRARDRHARLLAVGCTLALGGQAFWNMLVATGAAPTKGLTLPFISYGGSSVAISLALIGILDAVARSPATIPLSSTRSRPMGATVRTTTRRTPIAELPA